MPEDYELLDLMDEEASNTTAKADSAKSTEKTSTETKTESKSTEKSESKSTLKVEAKTDTSTQKVDATLTKDEKSTSKETNFSKPKTKESPVTHSKAKEEESVDENSPADVMPYWRANSAVLKDKMPGSASITIDAVEGNTTAPATGMPKYGAPSETWHARPIKWKGNY